MEVEQERKFGSGVTIIGHRCYRCEHAWKPKDLAELPEICPKCKSPYWDRPRKMAKPATEVES